MTLTPFISSLSMHQAAMGEHGLHRPADCRWLPSLQTISRALTLKPKSLWRVISTTMLTVPPCSISVSMVSTTSQPLPVAAMGLVVPIASTANGVLSTISSLLPHWLLVLTPSISTMPLSYWTKTRNMAASIRAVLSRTTITSPRALVITSRWLSSGRGGKKFFRLSFGTKRKRGCIESSKHPLFNKW